MGEAIIETKKLLKKFPGLVAVNEIDFELEEGEVHAIVGENGAGKSTFIKLLSGDYQANSGEIYFKGKSVGHHTPANAINLGIGVIYQEFYLIPEMSVAENIVLGYRNVQKKMGIIDWKKVYETAEGILGEMRCCLDVHAQIKHLDIADQQIVEIAKALAQKTKVIIMDEPTAALGSEDGERLFQIIRTLKAQGISVIYISHKLEEVFGISDRISVFRNGEKVLTTQTTDTNIPDIVKAMVGRNIEEMYIKTPRPIGDVIFEVKGLTKEPHIRNVNLTVRSGEVVGVFGLLGSGQVPLSRCVFGDLIPDSGEILVGGKRRVLRNPGDAKKARLGYVPLDRKEEGLSLVHSISRNITLSNLQDYSQYGILNEFRERRQVKAWVRDLSIRASSIDLQTGNLSGGNQQKTVIAKMLETKPDVMILNEPTRGVDVGAKAEIYAIVDQLCAQKKGILLVSLDLAEIVGISDRVLILHKGTIVSELTGNEITQENVLKHANAVGSACNE